MWHFLDRESEIDKTCRNRPHWDQTGALTFVTFRLADSMPRAVLRQWQVEQQQWLKRHGFTTGSIEDALKTGRIPENLRRLFLKFRKQRWNENLDDCHGRCLLRDTELASIVGKTLLSFEGDRYDVERFVVMPNHVHLLVQMKPGWGLRKQCTLWTRFSARAIHARIQESGEFWQTEAFDHIVRSEEQFRYLQTYVVENPRQARLRNGEYLLWIRGAGYVTLTSLDSKRGE